MWPTVSLLELSKEAVKVNDTLGHVFDALISHQDNVHMQEGACRFLTKLLELRPEVVDCIGEQEDQLPLHNSVLAAMNIHLDNSSVFQAACNNIYIMASSSPVLQNYFVAKGAYISIVNRMREAMCDPEVQEWGCRALRALCFNNVYQKELLVTYATLSDLISLLDEHQFSIAVMEEVIGLLACLSSDVELVCRQCLLERVHLKVLNIISQESGTTALYEVSFELFASFCSSEERDVLVEGKVLERVQELMKKCRKDASLQRKGCMVIQVLADSSLKNDKEFCLKLIAVIKDALKSFPRDIDLQTEALVALHVISSLGQVLTEQLVEEKVYETLFSILERFPSCQLSSLASECLCDLCWEQSSKDQMLRSACRSGQYRVVDFLLRVDADPDAGPIDDTALCIVVKNGDFKLAELLLEAGASSFEAPLKQALLKSSYKLAGILLRKIGLDKKGSLISWSGLHLQELKLEYFFGSSNFTNSDMLNFEDMSEYVQRVHAASKRRTASSPRARCMTDGSETTIDEIDVCKRPQTLDSVEESVFIENEVPTDDVLRPLRPRTLSGAILPFSRSDPRIEQRESDSSKVLPLQLGSPKLEIYYPGFPNSTLFSDPSFGRLLSSGNLPCGLNRKRRMPRSSSQALPELHSPVSSPDSEQCSSAVSSSTGESSDDSVTVLVGDKPKRRTLSHFRSTGSLLKKDRTNCFRAEPSGPVIKFIDLSCNELKNLNVLSSSNVLMRHLVKHLEKLDASQNLITYISQDLCKSLGSLRQLYISENALIDFPYDLLPHKVLEILDLSHNRIHELLEAKLESNIYLSRLNLGYNHLSQLPSWLSVYFPALTSLSFAFNRIQTLPTKSLALYHLRELYLCGNKIKALPKDFLRDCPSLKKLNLSKNELTTLPDVIDLSFCPIQVLNLSHNQLTAKEPFFVPPFVLRLPNLRILNLSHNEVTQIPPPISWRSNTIEELIFDSNAIRKINLGTDVSQWCILQRLSVSNNRLEEISPEIGLLRTLRSFNVSNNPKLTKVPDELGRLSLREFPLAGLKLNIDPSVNLANPAEIMAFLLLRLKRAVSYHRIKLMFVGLGGRGKSTLLRQLRLERHPNEDIATVGVKVQDWLFRQPKSHATKNGGKKYPSFVISAWDFAGQEDFYSTHQCFLSRRALYLAVFDASRGSKELELLRPWLLNIQAGAPGAAVILVGTHADAVRKENSKDFVRDLNKRIREFIRSPGFPDIKGYAIINCTKETKDIDQLRCKVFDVIINLTYRGQKILGQKVPKSYVQLEDLIKKRRLAMRHLKLPPVLSKGELMSSVIERGIQLDKDELIHAMKFLNESGVIIFFDESKAGLDNLIFIDPEWLCQMLAKVVTVRQVNPFISADGILLKSDLQKLYTNEDFPKSFDENYLKLLRKFEIILPLDGDRNLVPCRLPSYSPTEADILLDNRHWLSKAVCRRYVFPYIPIGFWSRMITRMMIFADAVIQRELGTPQKLVKEYYWQDGIYKYWNEDCFFLVCTSKSKLNAVDILVPTSKDGYMLLGHIVDHAETLLEEWYPGLSNSLNSEDDVSAVKRLAPCRSCQEDAMRHDFAVNECIDISFESDVIWCPVEESYVPLSELTPDIVMQDLGGAYVIGQDEIDLKQDDSNLLGDGSYGTVYKARYKNQNVAVKVFGGTSFTDRHRQLRREVNILRGLRCSSLISMVGVCLRPRTLVMELAPMGALSNVLKSGKPLSRTLQYRISHQVVDGLAFLHRNKIVYRDLKPSNILLFSLSSGVLINAKIADYGISQYATPLGLASNEGTSYYRAPEIEKGGTGYNTEVDIYSLGVTLYDIVTTGAWKYGPNAEFIMLTSRTYKPIASFGCSPWPDMEDLIRRCIVEQPEMRPSSQEILNRISSADFLCLRLEVRVCKQQSIECMAVRKASNQFRDKLEVWVGSGDSEGLSQISWFDPTSHSKPSCRGTVIKEGRILCMTTWHSETIVLGTKQGFIVLFDAELHKQSRTLNQLSSQVLCMKVLSTNGRGDYLLVGLADGKLVIYPAAILAGKDTAPEILTLGTLDTPVTCIVSGRKRVFLGVGGEVMVLHSDSYALENSWRACSENDGVVSSIVLGRRLWTASKGSCLVHAWDVDKGIKVETVDCFNILSAKHPVLSKRDSRAISLFLNKRETLWIGTGLGHIILIDITSKCTPIAVFSRHVSNVRCFASCSGSVNEKPISLVLSGGLGLKDHSCERHGETGHEDGSVLIWESDLARQHTHLENDKRARERRATAKW